MLQCAIILEQQPEFETDLLIYPVMKVIQFVGEVCETYRSEGICGPRLYIHAERFTIRLEEWWSSLSTDLRKAGKNFTRSGPPYFSELKVFSTADQRLLRSQDSHSRNGFGVLLWAEKTSFSKIRKFHNVICTSNGHQQLDQMRQFCERVS